MIIPSDPLELAALLGRRLDGAASYLDQFDRYYDGRQSSAYTSAASLEAMNGALSLLNVNLCRLAVLSLAERLRLLGFRIDGGRDADPAVWASFVGSGMDTFGADQVHVDAFVHGRSYVIGWVDEQGEPLITAESARHVTTITDPASRRVLAAMKRWFDQPDPDQPTGQAHADLFLPDRVISLETDQDHPVSGYPAMTGGAWHVARTAPNPLGLPPVVPFLNGYGRRSLNSIEGESELPDLMPLVDAIAKLTQDQMVTSETAARPRRWATGLELIPQRDPETGEEMSDPETGDPLFVNPFDSDALRVWQAEHPDVRFGQFPQADLSGFQGAINQLTAQAGAVATLPAHYLGLHGDQPPSADSVRASEASLTTRSVGKQRMFARPWGQVAALEVALRTGRDPLAVQAIPVWASAETRTPSLDADYAAKLNAIGVPLPMILSEALSWGPEQIAAARTAAQQTALDRQGIDLGSLDRG